MTRSRLPTAIFCHTDEMAFGAIAALRRAGIRCPEDMSVAGFDDHPMSVYWGLTTITQHAHEQGARAALALLAALDEDTDDGQVDASELVNLTVQLVPRESTRAV